MRQVSCDVVLDEVACRSATRCTAIEAAMHTMRIRIVDDETRAETLMNMLHAMDGVAQVEEVPLSPARFNGDGADHAVSHIEVAVADGAAAQRIRVFTASTAMLRGASAEFVDRFGIDNP
ncbi:MAG: hypothetical protein WBG81_15350 [Rhodanobacter sp.]|uniref:hypothetical protein n=1 Tax=Rhodanobacter sp. KK11 TaxID=3083255 RepID=UPI0029666D4C|nr:hypothetical protein [Rhodanobacter sp. KK11]MDW2981732.1 hypothetical protein [Rhodanobacter sp. KK11]